MLATLSAFLLALLLCVAAESLPYAPEPPEDWEQHVDPRFDPPVEKTLVDFYYERMQPEELVAIWNGWGFEALERLSALHEDEGWRGFRYEIAPFILAAPHPPLRDYVRDLLLDHALPDREVGDWSMSCDLQQSLLSSWYLSEHDTTHELAATFAREASLCLRVRATLLLLRSNDGPSQQLAQETIDVLAQSIKEEERAAAVRLILASAQNEADYERALALSQTVDDPQSLYIVQRREAARGRWRAEEAMDNRKRGLSCTVTPVKGGRTDANRDRALIQIITDPASDAHARHKAQINLVTLGTRRSIRAWLDLRDAARAHPDAPEAQAEYTHKEKIFEAFLMYHLYIPKHFGDNSKHLGNRSDYKLADVQVSDDYCSAKIWVNFSSPGASSYRLSRHGDEWLLSEYDGTVVP